MKINSVRAWLAAVWIGIGLEGIWFFLAIGIFGIINPKDLAGSIRFASLIALWAGLVYGAVSFK
jgi:hypothetical protein